MEAPNADQETPIRFLNRRDSSMSNEKQESRPALEAKYGQVWDAEEFARDFVATAIIGLTVVARRKTDNTVGTLEYQNDPRFYYQWQPNQATE
jgi:hypothetical protein